MAGPARTHPKEKVVEQRITPRFVRLSNQELEMRNGLIAILVTILIAGVLLALAPSPSLAQRAAGPARAVRPAPRWPDGRVRLSAAPGEQGLWGGSGRLAINPRSYEPRT